MILFLEFSVCFKCSSFVVGVLDCVAHGRSAFLAVEAMPRGTFSVHPLASVVLIHSASFIWQVQHLYRPQCFLVCADEPVRAHSRLTIFQFSLVAGRSRSVAQAEACGACLRSLADLWQCGLVKTQD